MKPLPMDALGFQPTLGKTEDGRARLELRYFVHHDGHDTDLIQIELEDSLPPSRDEDTDRLRFWFYYQPIQQTLGDEEKPLLRRFPAIDLIVFSSVRVTVQRMVAELDRFQEVGVEGLPADSRMRGALFSPFRPKISLRRVHDEAQIPMLGAPFHLQLLKADFSFYVDEQRKEHYTTRSSLADLIRSGEASDPDALLLPRRSWTRVFFDARFTEFNFVRSTYRLRVHDQHFDHVDGDVVISDERYAGVDKRIPLAEAYAREHTAARLISRPKYFKYTLSLDGTPHLMKSSSDGGYTVEYRPAIHIEKSNLVHMEGSLLRSVHSDRWENQLIRKRYAHLGSIAPEQNYRDYLPTLTIENENGQRVPRGDLEESWSGAAAYVFEKSAHVKYMEFQFSLIVGFTPILGTAFGLYELYTALTEDRDAFGNRLTDTEKILVGIGAMLPLMDGTMLRAGHRTLTKEMFPQLAETARKGQAQLARLRAVVVS